MSLIDKIIDADRAIEDLQKGRFHVNVLWLRERRLAHATPEERADLLAKTETCSCNLSECGFVIADADWEGCLAHGEERGWALEIHPFSRCPLNVIDLGDQRTRRAQVQADIEQEAGLR